MEATRKKKVFISYAREDQESALEIKKFLEQNGVSTWFDIEDVLPGAVWRAHARAAIEDVDFFIALLSETSAGKRDGYVWEEFELALAMQREFGADRIFILPVSINPVIIPEEFATYNCLPLSNSSLKKILRYIERRKRRRQIIAWILLACLIPFTTLPFFDWEDKKQQPAAELKTEAEQTRVRLICNVTVRDSENEHIQGVYAFIPGNHNDTIVQSPPSGTNGRIHLTLDTTNEVRAEVWFYHPLYETISKSYSLTEHDTYRVVYLELKKENAVAPASSVKAKSFALTGLTLTEAEKKNIKDNTGYSFSYNAPTVKIAVDYDHDRFTDAAVKDKYVFEGSKVYLIHNSTKTDTGIFLPQDASLPRSKADIEKDNEIPFQQLLAAKRNEIVNSLIACLKDY